MFRLSENAYDSGLYAAVSVLSELWRMQAMIGKQPRGNETTCAQPECPQQTHSSVCMSITQCASHS